MLNAYTIADTRTHTHTGVRAEGTNELWVAVGDQAVDV